MGYAMASNIRKKMSTDATLYINDINSSACVRFKDEHSSYGNIEIVSTAREAANDANVVISIVPGASDVKQVYLDETHGVIAATKNSERILCECSTIDVQTTREVGEKLKAAGLGTYIDTPVSVSHTTPPSSSNPLTAPTGRRPRRRTRRPLTPHRPPLTLTLQPLPHAPLHHPLHDRLPPQILLPHHPRRRPHRQNIQQLPLGHHPPRHRRSPRHRRRSRARPKTTLLRDPRVNGAVLDVRPRDADTERGRHMGAE